MKHFVELRSVTAFLLTILVFGVASLEAQSMDPLPAKSSRLKSYTLDANASGVIETINNIVNMTVVSRDANDLKAEHLSG